MPEALSLFELPSPETKVRLQAKLRMLAAQKLYLGTSSWKYEGWLNQIYTPERYRVRGKFSRKKFAAECLAEYAETFPIVCGDFSFYQFPPPAFWDELFSSIPPQFLFTFKVPEDITVFTFPQHPRYGGRKGMRNPHFLNPELVLSQFLAPLSRYRERVPVLVFEFGAFPPRLFADAPEFADVLSTFFACLPADFRYAVEIRNPEFLEEPYFAALREHRVAHVFNAWTRMPEIGKQMQVSGAFTTDFTIVRALLRAGRPYEQAVRLFAPYEKLQDPNPEVRRALRQLLVRAKQRSEPTYIFINNRLEGNAPSTVEAILEDTGD
jgi:uncharacterized protein YecE (DUF72 family)